jgi:hypothetical protein
VVIFKALCAETELFSRVNVIQSETVHQVILSPQVNHQPQAGVCQVATVVLTAVSTCHVVGAVAQLTLTVVVALSSAFDEATVFDVSAVLSTFQSHTSHFTIQVGEFIVGDVSVLFVRVFVVADNRVSIFAIVTFLLNGLQAGSST